MAEKFYKKSNLIAVYDMNDNLVSVCDNVYEFSVQFKKDLTLAFHIVGRIAKGYRNFFRYDGSNYTIHVIPLEPLDIIDIQNIDCVKC